MTHQPGVYVPLRALFLVLGFFSLGPFGPCLKKKMGPSKKNKGH